MLSTRRPRHFRSPERASQARAAGVRGFTFVEIMIVLVILVVALGIYASTVVSLSRSGPINRETALAMEAARSKLEELYSVPADEAFARYNASPADDPGGAGTAPGNTFAVFGLDLQEGDPDGFVGQVQFPTIGGALREDVDDRALGMPRDLNLDSGVIDALDHSLDYQILPVRVRIEWRGRGFNRSVELSGALSEL